MSLTPVSIQKGVMRQVIEYIDAQPLPKVLTQDSVKSVLARAYLCGYANCCELLTINDGSLTPQMLTKGLGDVFGALGVSLTRKELSTESNREQT